MNSKGAIRCHAEVFHPNKVFVSLPEVKASPELREMLKRERAADPIGFLERLYEAGAGFKAVGFKLFPGQNDQVMEHVIRDPAIRKIVLYRDNVLAVYSSNLIANATGRFSGMDVGPQAMEVKVEFDPVGFAAFHDRYVRRGHHMFEAVSSCGQICHPVEYTQLSEPALTAGIAAFLGLDPSTINRSPRPLKQNSSDILSRFSNPEAAHDFLAERDLLGWAYEGRTDWTLLAEDSKAEPPAPLATA